LLPAEEYLDLFYSESDSSGDLGHSDSDAELVEVSSVIAGRNSEFGRQSVSGGVIAPSVLVPSDGVFGRFDLVALRLPHLKCLFVCLFVCLFGRNVFIWGMNARYAV
jgi:hypothetical protein